MRILKLIVRFITFLKDINEGNWPRKPQTDWWDELDTTVEHRTRMFQGRDITEIGKVPDAET